MRVQEQRELIESYLENAKRLEMLRRAYPLALAKLWRPHCHRWDGSGPKSDRPRGCGQEMRRVTAGVYRCDACDIQERRTSQQEALLSLGSEATIITGGNRAGKSETGTMLAVATAAGSNEWWVQEWIRINDLPPDIVPENPGTVWMSALSYGDALTYLRPKIEKYCPKGTRFVRWRAQDRASALLPNGGKIQSLSAESGREKFQGAAITLAILDEEHPQDIFDECMLRTVDNNGRIVLTMTPLKGITWPHDVFFEKPRHGYNHYAISGLDNPWISSNKLMRAIGHMSEEAKRSRLFGEFTNQQGLVYSEFSRAIHVVEHFEPPEHWPRDRSIDFGVRNPFACLWFAHDEADDTLHVIGEYYKTERTTLENGREINRITGDQRIRWTVADPESRDGRLLLARECNMPTKTAPKYLGVVDTINYVKERLALDAEGKPHLVIHDNCRQLLRELRLYRWSDGAGKDKPIKRDDHGLDALRYQIAFLRRYLLHQ